MRLTEKILRAFDGRPFGKTEMNAMKLCDAAPDLLAALQEIIDLQPDDDGDRIIPPGFLDQARAVVKRAMG